MCPVADGGDGEGQPDPALEAPAVCWGQDALAPKRDRLSGAHRRRLGLGALVVAVALVLLAVAALGGSGGSATGKPGPLAQVAYVTAQAPGFKFELTMNGSLGQQSFTIGAEGSMDERSREGTMQLQVAGQTLTEIIKNPYVYVSVPSGGAALSAGKPWLRANLNTFGQAFGASSSLGSNTTGPTQMLSLLKAGGQVSTVGEQNIRGVRTTHYHALVDFSRYASVVPAGSRAATERSAAELERMTGSDSLPIDVWVDSGQRVRRVSTQLRLCTAQGPLTESLTMDLFDYGAQPPVSAPAPGEASDISGMLAGQASQALKQLSCES
jgi:hypothetical protein